METTDPAVELATSDAELTDAEKLDRVYRFVSRLEPFLEAAEAELPELLEVARSLADSPLVKMLGGGPGSAEVPGLSIARLFSRGRS